MSIAFAQHGMMERQQSAFMPVRPLTVHLGLTGFEGNSLSFATIDPLTEARGHIPPSYTNGFASGPASVGGSNGHSSEMRGATRFRSPPSVYAKLIGAGAMLLCADCAALANNDAGNEPVTQSNHTQAVTKNTSRAAVRIVAMIDDRSRARFSASGLPAALSIDPRTGVISGTIDREANRNGGAPFVVKVVVNNGTAASGVSNLSFRIENQPPVVADDILDLSATAATLNVLLNDIDPDGDRLVLTDADAQHGSVVFTTGGNVTYAAHPGNGRLDTITYRVSDGHGGIAAGKVEIIVK